MKSIAVLVVAAYLDAAMGVAQSTMLRPSKEWLPGHACQGGLFHSQHTPILIFAKLQTPELMMIMP